MIKLIYIELFKIIKRPRTYIGFLAIFVTVGAIQLAMYFEGEELIAKYKGKVAGILLREESFLKVKRKFNT